MINFKELLTKQTKREISDDYEKKLIAKGYIYNEVFGWEKIDIINRFDLDPNMTGIPCSFQAEWIKGKNRSRKDNRGNTIQAQAGEWIRSETKKKLYPIDNWFAYMIFKKKRNIGNVVVANNMDNIVAYGE